MAQSYSKNTRLNLVMETVKALGKGLPGDVCARVAQRLNEDPSDAAFVRAIYRDLKQLADEGRLIAEAYSPDGSQLDPDTMDTAKNIRLEYRLPDSADSEIPGAKLWVEAGGRLIPPARKMGWKVSFAINASAAKVVSLMFQVTAGRWGVLQLPLSELPAKILICRESESESFPADTKQVIAEQFGLRTLVFATPDRSVSRASSSGRLGHAVISLQPDGKMSIQDLGSKGGTFVAPADETILQSAFSAQFAESTVPMTVNPFEAEVSWSPVSGTARDIPHAAVLRLGAFRIALLRPDV